MRHEMMPPERDQPQPYAAEHKLALVQDAVSTSHGWAVLTNEGIDMRTVSDTRRAAIVNWLAVSASILMLAWMNDEYIEKLWQEHRGNVRAIPVKVQSAVAFED